MFNWNFIKPNDKKVFPWLLTKLLSGTLFRMLISYGSSRVESTFGWRHLKKKINWTLSTDPSEWILSIGFDLLYGNLQYSPERVGRTLENND